MPRPSPGSLATASPVSAAVAEIEADIAAEANDSSLPPNEPASPQKNGAAPTGQALRAAAARAQRTIDGLTHQFPVEPPYFTGKVPNAVFESIGRWCLANFDMAAGRAGIMQSHILDCIRVQSGEDRMKDADRLKLLSQVAQAFHDANRPNRGVTMGNYSRIRSALLSEIAEREKAEEALTV